MATAAYWDGPREASRQFSLGIAEKLRDVRGVQQSLPDSLSEKADSQLNSISDILSAYITALQSSSRLEEADVLDLVKSKVNGDVSFGGLGLDPSRIPSKEQYDETLFLVESWLESLNSRDRAPQKLSIRSAPGPDTKPMTLAEKIFSQHAVGPVPEGGLSVGDVVRVGVDWILASELSWNGMATAYEELGSPEIWRNDRFWLAGDHVVHPSITDVPKIRAYIDKAEFAKKRFKMTEYQGMNYTIMHTEFVRERAEPGMLCFGSDSHTCSAGAVGCLSIGMGGADVMMTLALGETWFKIPESILIELHGKPAPAIAGKDVILHILKILKRNTVAAERIVEFSGDGLAHLSCDARFAIANMCTEFGAITGVFVPDRITKAFIEKRHRKTNRSASLYFRPDAGAHYAGRYRIDLSQVEPSIAVYPNPDNVVPVSEKAGLKLDGVFIGACTTTEEELVLAALVLKVGLQKKLPQTKGKRHYVPGSLPIVERLRKLGLLEVYEAAGFTRGPPGCSYCVGLTAEKAAEGETWLSSQNRNFENRMGPGSFGHVTSAVVCAASSFNMSVTSPLELLKEIDTSFLQQYRKKEHGSGSAVDYVEPILSSTSASDPRQDSSKPNETKDPGNSAVDTLGIIKSKVVRLGDFIDTDALAPGPTLTTCTTDEEFGEHVLEYTHPDFRGKVRGGQRVVVAGNAFGVGSSRECAVSALKGAGVNAVIAKAFAFIYGRNQPSLGLLGFTITDEEFYQTAEEGAEISIDVPARKVVVAGKEFPFVLSDIEYNLTANRGITRSFNKFGTSIWSQMTKSGSDRNTNRNPGSESNTSDDQLSW